ncbi:hypothetical protein LTR17_022655 [Elasticomyces elasticus]|nr:hypothetical protein LTR17_022655 [Elasticomyces elasticus]
MTLARIQPPTEPVKALSPTSSPSPNHLFEPITPFVPERDAFTVRATTQIGRQEPKQSDQVSHLPRQTAVYVRRPNLQEVQQHATASATRIYTGA